MPDLEAITIGWSYSQTFHFFGPKVFFAILCGGLIGLEREFRDKPAGVKTNTLICLGSALYTAVSVVLATTLKNPNGYFSDVTRVAAQIVSGVGFLGGGAIIQARGTVRGLTTAATIWVVAAIGMFIGLGNTEVGVGVTVLVIPILLLADVLERILLGHTYHFSIEVLFEDESDHARSFINELLSKNELTLSEFQENSTESGKMISLRYNGHRLDHRNFLLALWSTPGVKAVKHTKTRTLLERSGVLRKIGHSRRVLSASPQS
jgi:putative Mg2+ transporter-C (MgtC) family protein